MEAGRWGAQQKAVRGAGATGLPGATRGEFQGQGGGQSQVPLDATMKTSKCPFGLGNTRFFRELILWGGGSQEAGLQGVGE